ncbi:hypothetical protein CC80DRAFT_538519 [Byssothecium circinans]|uniref:Uncharacterized protein n=1 Tax=Byssothecium circinans TaxID=147558 RepID=A0A6A5TGT9_9PLEO|nr:hypothetical protein CC80DRAFT_538519 [Byssothecium circinans]
MSSETPEDRFQTSSEETWTECIGEWLNEKEVKWKTVNTEEPNADRHSLYHDPIAFDSDDDGVDRSGRRYWKRVRKVERAPRNMIENWTEVDGNHPSDFLIGKYPRRTGHEFIMRYWNQIIEDAWKDEPAKEDRTQRWGMKVKGFDWLYFRHYLANPAIKFDIPAIRADNIEARREQAAAQALADAFDPTAAAAAAVADGLIPRRRLSFRDANDEGFESEDL